MKRSTVTFTIEHDEDWTTVDPGLRRHVVPIDGWGIWIPADATVETEDVFPAIKVGDVLRTPEELGRCVVHTVILDCDDDAWQLRRSADWCFAGEGERPTDPKRMVENYGSEFKVIHVPDNA